MSQLQSATIVLIADDSESYLPLLTELRSLGASVTHVVCENATSLLTKSAAPDVIILGYGLPGSQCNGLLTELHNTEVTKRTPIIVYVDSNTEVTRVLEHGAVDFVFLGETTDVVVQKICSTLAVPTEFDRHSDIDISSPEISIANSGVRVFVIEDDPLLRNLLSIRLSQASIPFEFAGDGMSAVTKLMQFKPDVVVLDLMLPGRSGFEVLEEIRTTDEYGTIPVIVFSNRDAQEDRERAQSLGAARFYVKAMTDLSELVTEIYAVAENPHTSNQPTS